jgi:predicted Rossmann fold nucleotide-binding protein DprA/Smf involved in DNA uptake
MRNREYSAFMLLNAPGFGAKSIYYIYENLERNHLTVNDLFDLDNSQYSKLFPEIGQGKFSRASFTSLAFLDDDNMYNSFQKLKDEQVYIIGLDDERYPQSVKEKLKQNAPPVLFCKGHLPLLNTKGISIVGSRDVSDFAVMLTKRIANRLAEHGFNVTSGYAKGVDTSAHLGALEGNGTTTMILSYGVNHLSIKKDIKDFNWEKNTLFVTQFMPYEKFSGQNAMIRNKLVCAMSQAVIVISSGPERDSSGKMSGTFDAGLSALNMKVPLFVLEPELLKPTPPRGNYDLIKLGGISLSNGAELIQYLEKLNDGKVATDIVPQNEYNKVKQEETNTLNEPIVEFENIETKILKALNGSPLSAKDILTKSKLDWTTKKLTPYLKKIEGIVTIKRGRENLYTLKENFTKTPTLF